MAPRRFDPGCPRHVAITSFFEFANHANLAELAYLRSQSEVTPQPLGNSPDTQALRACVRPASAGSSDLASGTGVTVDASPPIAEPADSQGKEAEPMPPAQQIMEGASGDCDGARGADPVSNRTPADGACSRFVLGFAAEARGNFFFGRSWGHIRLDAHLRACLRPASAGSSDLASGTGVTVDASPPIAEPADRAVQGHDRAPNNSNCHAL